MGNRDYYAPKTKPALLKTETVLKVMAVAFIIASAFAWGVIPW